MEIVFANNGNNLRKQCPLFGVGDAGKYTALYNETGIIL
jgi:hypothetical protein